MVKIAGNFMLIMPVITLFFKENGLSMHDIFVLQSLFSVAVIFLEIPSGYFSDRIGRRKTLIAGHLFIIGGYFCYSLASGFWQFVIAEVLLGFGISFSSGTDTALLYDTLLEGGGEEYYSRLEGRRFSAGLVSEAIASVLGGVIALVSLRLPLYLETTVIIASFPVVLSIVEPAVCSVENKKNAMEGILDIIKDLLRKGNGLKWVILYSSVISASTLTMVWMIQPYLKEVGISIGAFGIIWAGLMLLSAFISWNTEKIKNFFGEKKILTSLVVMVSVGYFSLMYFWSSWSIIFMGLFYLVRGIHDPIVSAYINRQISSNRRATILSIKNLFSRILFSIVGPIVGWISDVFSLKEAIFYSGIIFLFLGCSTLFMVYKKKAV